MLWYKAWLETRTRFLVCLVTITAFCAFYVHLTLDLPHVGATKVHDIYYYRVLFLAHDYVVALWVICVVLMGMGGIVREKANGVSSFTLALPVSRLKLILARAGLGCAEAIVLGAVPWIAITTMVSSRSHVPWMQFWLYFAPAFIGGLIFYAMSLFVSTAIEGEYTAPVAAFAVAYAMTFSWAPPPSHYSLFRLMQGVFNLDPRTFLMAGSTPWMGIVASLCGAMIMVFASAMIAQRREF